MQSNWIWDHTFLDNPKDDKNFICLVVLNQRMNASLFKWMYNLADFSIYADGGSDIIKNFFKGELYNSFLSFYSSKFKPSLILGDMDSVAEDTRKAYESLGVKILVDADVDRTDCEKALNYLEQHVIPDAMKAKERNVKIIVLGAFGGRMDHTLQNINLLWMRASKSPIPQAEIMMFDELNMMTVLRPKHNEIRRSKKMEASKGCGIVPLAECEQIATQGLKYNMGR